MCGEPRIDEIKSDGFEVFENKWIIEIKIMDQHKVKKF